MTIFRDFQGPKRDIGIARPRHSKTCLEIETRLETSSSGSKYAELPLTDRGFDAAPDFDFLSA